MRKLAFQPSDVDQGGLSRRNSLRRHATPDFLLASPADRDFSQVSYQFTHRGSGVLSSPSPDLPSFHYAPPPWQRTESMDSEYSGGGNESSLDHLHSSGGEEYDGTEMEDVPTSSTGTSNFEVYLTGAAPGPQPKPSPQVSLMRRGSHDSVGVRMSRTSPVTPRIVHHSLPPLGYTPAPTSLGGAQMDSSIFQPGSVKHGRPFEAMCVDPFERKKRRVGSSNEIGRFRCDFTDVELVGKGSFSDVFRAKNKIDGQVYAIKRVKKQCSTEAEKKSVQKEASVLAILAHASDQNPSLSRHVIRYYSSWFEEAGRLFIQTEYCDFSIPELINDAGGSLEESVVVSILRDIACGLKFIHSLNLVHLDVKPANIFQSSLVFKLGDMGLVSPAVVDEKRGPPEITSGDARYLPREILLNNFKHLTKADIFSLGATVLECMLGERLEAEGEEWHKIRDGHLPLDELIGYSKALVELVSRMMAPDPDNRPTCDEILNAIIDAPVPLTVLQPHNLLGDLSPVSMTSAGTDNAVDKENGLTRSSPGKAIMRSLKHTRQKLRKLFTAAT